MGSEMCIRDRDYVVCNTEEEECSATVLAPLSTESGIESDHNIVLFQAGIKRERKKIRVDLVNYKNQIGKRKCPFWRAGEQHGLGSAICRGRERPDGDGAQVSETDR